MARVDSRESQAHSDRMMETETNILNSAEQEALAVRLEGEQRLMEARDAFDAALRLNPASRPAAEGRARIALQLREEGAAEHCARALAYHDDDPELQFQMIATAAVEIGIEAMPLLETYLARRSTDVKAHELLADLRAQSGAEDAFVDGYVAALAQHPDNAPLLMSYWSMLSRSGRYRQATESMDAHRSKFEGNREFAMLEVAIAGHSGEIDKAGRLLETFDGRPDAQLARGLNRLQTNRPDEAAELLSSVIDLQPDNFEAWALLEVAWRITNNPRHQWLVGEPRLYGSSELALTDHQLSQVAATLRTLHTASAHPVGQSLRGGTQTAGQLFLRSEPEIVTLIEALAVAVRNFVESLPAADSSHPLLKHRNSAMAFGPSWSVRFTGEGHHAAHFHPGGVLSSACYISLPQAVEDREKKQGWLEIGRPPAEMGLDWPALDTFEPKPGRLVLFPSFLFHGTRPFEGGERMTVAFDIVPVQRV